MNLLLPLLCCIVFLASLRVRRSEAWRRHLRQMLDIYLRSFEPLAPAEPIMEHGQRHDASIQQYRPVHSLRRQILAFESGPAERRCNHTPPGHCKSIHSRGVSAKVPRTRLEPIPPKEELQCNGSNESCVLPDTNCSHVSLNSSVVREKLISYQA